MKDLVIKFSEHADHYTTDVYIDLSNYKNKAKSKTILCLRTITVFYKFDLVPFKNGLNSGRMAIEQVPKVAGHQILARRFLVILNISLL